MERQRAQSRCPVLPRPRLWLPQRWKAGEGRAGTLTKVDSNSREMAPKAFSNLSFLVMSRITTSVGSLIFRISHHMT